MEGLRVKLSSVCKENLGKSLEPVAFEKLLEEAKGAVGVRV